MRSASENSCAEYIASIPAALFGYLLASSIAKLQSENLPIFAARLQHGSINYVGITTGIASIAHDHVCIKFIVNKLACVPEIVLIPKFKDGEGLCEFWIDYFAKTAA